MMNAHFRMYGVKMTQVNMPVMSACKLRVQVNFLQVLITKGFRRNLPAVWRAICLCVSDKLL